MAHHVDSVTRNALMREYEDLSRDRNGMSPKASTYAKLTARMEEIQRQLKDAGDPEMYAAEMRNRRNKLRRSAVMRKKAMRDKGII